MNHKQNILNVLSKADPIETVEGRAAYRNYNRTLEEIADKFNLPLVRVAGAFSALSPNSDYRGNLRSTYTLCLGFTKGNAEEDCTVSTYNHNRAKAWRILQGEHFYSVFKGLKVRAFFRNITEPDHPEAITIDGHMFNIYRNQTKTMSESGFSRGKYEKIASVFRKVAEENGLLPCELQAILWLVWKRLNGILSDYAVEQDLLFTDINRCGIYVPVETIKTYKIDTKQKVLHVTGKQRTFSI